MCPCVHAMLVTTPLCVPPHPAPPQPPPSYLFPSGVSSFFRDATHTCHQADAAVPGSHRQTRSTVAPVNAAQPSPGRHVSCPCAVSELPSGVIKSARCSVSPWCVGLGGNHNPTTITTTTTTNTLLPLPCTPRDSLLPH
ncbi:hypothetical protein E2C01_032159 [Portunus trituberculatus]|uniref:Uncharacterized protein n=1 Tax=Portunus trituberculatus TaxID=210409 RepID=A0A5B7F079_PORTR|nr:hypothetical protein [Portunus trituberculatus]